MRLVYTLPHHPRALRGFSILLLFVFVFLLVIFCPTCVLLVFYFFIVTSHRQVLYIHAARIHTDGLVKITVLGTKSLFDNANDVLVRDCGC